MKGLLRLTLAALLVGCTAGAPNAPERDASDRDAGQQSDGTTTHETGSPDLSRHDSEAGFGDGASADCRSWPESACTGFGVFRRPETAQCRPSPYDGDPSYYCAECHDDIECLAGEICVQFTTCVLVDTADAGDAGGDGGPDSNGDAGGDGAPDLNGEAGG